MFQFEIDDENEVLQSDQIDNNSGEIVFEVGNRIICEDEPGVIRYIGPVTPHPGTWLGIEWDNPARGKHNGNLDGVQYFKCVNADDSKTASFIRPHKAKKMVDIITALNERYGHDEEVMNRLKLMDERLESMRIVYRDLRLVDLASKRIFDLGKPGEFAHICPNIEFLVLPDNLISSWESIAGRICKYLPKLRRLDLSENPLVEENNIEKLVGSFSTLEHLILGKIKCDWNTIIKMSPLWPRLSNLQLPFNRVSTILTPQTTLLNLISLDLEGNLISSWDEVMKLNVCSRLEYLNLCRNKIESVRFPPRLDQNKSIQITEIFPNLTRLILSENKIETWASINELNKLGKLEELRIDLNPFLEKGLRATNRQMIIARIGRLKKLEGVLINRQERRDAELDYVKTFSDKWDSDGTDLRFAVDHPRYLELVKLLGASEIGEISSGTKTMKTSLINLEFIPEDSSYKPYSKQLMPNMNVQKLKMLIQRNLKLRSSRIAIRVVSLRNPDISFTLENDFFDLMQYSIEDGDKLFLTW